MLRLCGAKQKRNQSWALGGHLIHFIVFLLSGASQHNYLRRKFTVLGGMVPCPLDPPVALRCSGVRQF